MISKIIALRRRLPSTRFGRALRRSGVHRPILAMYRFLLRVESRRRDCVHVSIGNTRVAFKVSSPAELSVLTNHWEVELIDRLASRLRSGESFYDVGANIGLFACCVGVRAGDEVEVHAFEPLASNAERLRENAALNKLTRVTVHPVAVSDTAGEAEFFADSECGSPVSSLDDGHLGASSMTHTSVACVRLPDFQRDNDLPLPNAVKIDIEGFEDRVLPTLDDWFRSPELHTAYIEYHLETLMRNGSSFEALHERILNAGFIETARTSRDDGTHPMSVLYERGMAGEQGGVESTSSSSS